MEHIAPDTTVNQTHVVGGYMSSAHLSTSRQPVLPSLGGLLGKNFPYRTAEKTDVRLTWQRAKESQQQSTSLTNSYKPVK